MRRLCALFPALAALLVAMLSASRDASAGPHADGGAHGDGGGHADAGADADSGLADELHLVTGYAAKETCSCVFVEGQTDAYCTKYGTSPTGLIVAVTIDHAAGKVTTSLYGNEPRTATFTAGKGCVLDIP